MLGDIPTGQDFAIPMFVVDSSLSRTADALKQQYSSFKWTEKDETLLNSALKRLRYAQFCNRVVSQPNAELLKILQTQKLREKFLFGQ